MGVIKTEAIALKGKDLGEADRLVTFFTRSSGKLRAVANGARRTRSNMSALVQPFTYSHLSIYQGASLARLRSGEIIQGNLSLREDLLLMTASSYLAEMVDFLMEEDDPNEAVFALLLNSLAILKERGVERIFLRSFEIRLMSILGYRPRLQNCVHCGEETKPGKGSAFFSVAQGGLKCADCVEESDREISWGTCQVLGRLLETPWRQLFNLRVDTKMQKELESLLAEFIEFRSERRFKTLSFLQTLLEEPS